VTSLIQPTARGERTEGDVVEFPNDDLKATQLPNGEWALTHKDGRPY